jgi:hypothetical protein
MTINDRTRFNRYKTGKGVLIGVINQHQSQEEVEDYLRELAFLTETAGATPGKFFFRKWTTQSANIH